MRRLICVISAILIFLLGSGFTTQAPIEYTDDGVIIRDIAYYNERLILSDSDQDLLMRIAIAEAGNQGVKGMALVMRVVLNRWQSGHYGETIHDVIYRKRDFYTPGMYQNSIFDVWESQLTQGQRRQILEARAAYAWVVFNWDESEGALYFCADGWNYYGKEHLFKYEDHWFSR